MWRSNFSLALCSYQFSLLISLLVKVNCKTSLDILKNQTSDIDYHLLSTFENLIIILQGVSEKSDAKKNHVIVFIHQENTWQMTSRFQERMSKFYTSFLNLQIKMNYSEVSINETLETLKIYQNYVHAVVVVMDDTIAFSALMLYVCSHTGFKWTYLLHVTEWIIVLKNKDHMIFQNVFGNCTDYLTFIMSTESGLVIGRKSRENKFSISRCPKQSWSIQDLSSYFKIKKSGLEGLHVPVAIVDNVRRYVEVVKSGNITSYKGFVITLLHVMASALKFEVTFVLPADDTFGFVNQDNTATGLTGLLARREVAFCNMGMSKTQNRLQVIDYIDTPLDFAPIHITYRLPKSDSDLDLTLFDIVQPEFFLLTLGPLLSLAVLGIVVHILTRSCTETIFNFTKEGVRDLTSFPDHICFHTDNRYTGQTGRILRGSWSVFWLILSAAYSAYLVTSFAVKPSELKIDSLEKLLATPGYKIGIWGSNSALLTELKISQNSVLSNIWRKVQIANKSDPLILSSDVMDHVNKLLSGGYVFVDHNRAVDLSFFLDADFSEVRSYAVQSLNFLAHEFVTVPKNVFYKEELNKILMSLEETGILAYLREKYNIYQPAALSQSTETQDSVSVSRILVLVYVSLITVAAAGCCLILEIIFYKLRIISAQRNDTMQSY